MEVAENGKTALSKLDNNHFDLAFCDWKMPGLNGQQVYEQVRRTDPRFCQRIIFITGDVINDQMRLFLETEKRPCLTKPCTLRNFVPPSKPSSRRFSRRTKAARPGRAMVTLIPRFATDRMVKEYAHKYYSAK